MYLMKMQVNFCILKNSDLHLRKIQFNFHVLENSNLYLRKILIYFWFLKKKSDNKQCGHVKMDIGKCKRDVFREREKDALVVHTKLITLPWILQVAFSMVIQFLWEANEGWINQQGSDTSSNSPRFKSRYQQSFIGGHSKGLARGS